MQQPTSGTEGTICNSLPLEQRAQYATAYLWNRGHNMQQPTSETAWNRGHNMQQPTSGTEGTICNSLPLEQRAQYATAYLWNRGHNMQQPGTEGTICNCLPLRQHGTEGTICNSLPLRQHGTEGTICNSLPLRQHGTEGTICNSLPLEQRAQYATAYLWNRGHNMQQPTWNRGHNMQQPTSGTEGTITAVQGLRFSCYSWAPEPRHPVHVTDIYATESRTPLVRELSADRFSVRLLLHCSPPTQGQSGGMGKGVWRPGTAVLSSQCGKTTHLLSLQITTNSSSL